MRLDRLNSMFRGFAAALIHPIAGWLAVVGLVVGIMLPATGIGLTTCSLKVRSGIPCPGCGLTRSVSCTLQGKPTWAWQFNPFGIGFAVAMVALAPTAFLTRHRRERLGERLTRHDGVLALAVFLFLGGLMLHGIVRAGMVYAEHPYYNWWKHDENPPFIEQDPHINGEGVAAGVPAPARGPVTDGSSHDAP